jgi:hypothetical protein
MEQSSTSSPLITNGDSLEIIVMCGRTALQFGQADTEYNDILGVSWTK